MNASTIADVAQRAATKVSGADVDTRSAAAEQVADTVGCVLAGSGHPTLARLPGLVSATTGAGGHRPLAAPELDTDLPTAIAVDAVAAHVDEYDAVHPGSGTVPAGIVVPTALAVGRHVHASGREVLDAVIAGYEVMVEVGRRRGGAGLYRRAWWPSLVAGPLGAAAATAHLLRLDVDRTAQALALASGGAGGLLTADVFADGHYWSFGEAAARGVRAAFGARHGLTASTSLLDDPAAAAFGPPVDPSPADAAPHVVGCVFKVSPSSMPFQPVAQALRELRGRSRAATVVEVRATIPAALLPFVTADTAVPGPPEAAASLAYVVAASLGPPGQDLDVIRRHDAEEASVTRVSLRGTESPLGPPGQLAAALEVVGDDGAAQALAAVFTPPATADRDKFARNAARAARPHPTFDELLAIGELADVTSLPW